MVGVSHAKTCRLAPSKNTFKAGGMEFCQFAPGLEFRVFGSEASVEGGLERGHSLSGIAR